MSIFARVVSFHFYEIIAIAALVASLAVFVTTVIIQRSMQEGSRGSFAMGVATGLGMKIRGAGISLEISDAQTNEMAKLIAGQLNNLHLVYSDPKLKPCVTWAKDYFSFENKSSFGTSMPSPGSDFELLTRIRDEAERQSLELYQINDAVVGKVAGMQRDYRTINPLLLEFKPLAMPVDHCIAEMRRSFVAAVMRIVTTVGVKLDKKPVTSEDRRRGNDHFQDCMIRPGLPKSWHRLTNLIR